MAITNPSLMKGFDVNGTNVSQPPSTQQDDGYATNEIPLADNHAFMFKEWYRYLQYLKETGISQYDSTVSYAKHARIMRNQNIYRSLSDANQGNDPLTASTFWQIDQWRMNTATHDITADSDYTLTDEQNNFGKIIITDTGTLLTAGRNIIMSDEEKDFIVQNDTLQILTVKTSAGTGIDVGVGLKLWLLCDGTNVIESTTINIATTAEAQAGIDNTKAITPLRLRDGLNAIGLAPIYASRAWVNFDGTGTVAIRDSGNVSSITDNGTGDYTANFLTAIDDSNYAFNLGVSRTDVLDTNFSVTLKNGTQLATSMTVITGSPSNGVLIDSGYISISINK